MLQPHQVLLLPEVDPLVLLALDQLGSVQTVMVVGVVRDRALQRGAPLRGSPASPRLVQACLTSSEGKQAGVV